MIMRVSVNVPQCPRHTVRGMCQITIKCLTLAHTIVAFFGIVTSNKLTYGSSISTEKWVYV